MANVARLRKYREAFGPGAVGGARLAWVRGGWGMLRTIMLGRYVWVQGEFVRNLPDGLIEVRVGSRTYAGRPVQAA